MSTDSYQLAELNDHITTSIDVFICSSSFESRCLAVSEHLDSHRVKRILMVQNENNAQYVGENGDRLLNRFGQKAEKIQIDTDDPLRTADGLAKGLERVCTTQDQTFLVDVSTFTRESLLILARLLHHFLKRTDTLLFAYVGAKRYSHNEEDTNKLLVEEGVIPQKDGLVVDNTVILPRDDETSEIWLSRGIREVRSVLGYLGTGIPSRNLHLIILVGFEHERTVQLIDVYEPAVLSLGYSPDETMPGYSHINKTFHNKVVASYGSQVQEFTFSAIDPVATKDAVIAQTKKFTKYNTVVCAMNTKISTLGAALAAFTDETIQLCYAQAETYNIKGYAKPKDSFYLFIPEMSDFVSEKDKIVTK